MDKKIGIAVIGTGGRCRSVISNLLRDSNHGVKIVAVYDTNENEIKKSLAIWQADDALIAQNCTEAITALGVSWVMIFSPNANHREHIEMSFAAGKNVFSEKPLATTVEDCQAIFAAHQKSGVQFATGFVLRYAPIYRKAKELLSSGRLGTLLSINANENITTSHGSYIMTNWRRLTKYSGPHILEKCCHDLDLINWFCESLPSKVASFANRRFFTKENRILENKYGAKVFQDWPRPYVTETPFTNDTDLKDNLISISQYRNGILVQFQATMSNTIPERRMYFNCTEGTMILELYKSSLTYRLMGEETVCSIDFDADGHGGGDAYIMKELYECMLNGTPPKCSGAEGLQSAVYALALDESSINETIIDMEPIWEKLNC